MNRRQHTRPHQEGAKEAEREGDDGEKHSPDLQRLTLLHHDGGVEQRGRRQPWHEGGVLDRVPEPPATPAKLVIGPVRAHRDAGGEEHPRRERPRANPPRPGSFKLAFDQSGDGKGERNRAADIAEIEKRRMDREAYVLEDGGQIRALERRKLDTLERIGGDQDEGKERNADPALHRKHVGLQPIRQIVAEDGDAGTE